MTKTILIVDDSISMRQLVKATLSGAGYTAREYGDGKAALAFLTEGNDNRVDLILTDLNMPIMDGLTFTRAVRDQAIRARFVPILVLTTETSPQMKAAGKAAGATGWIVKPFQPEQLLRVIEKVLPS